MKKGILLMLTLLLVFGLVACGSSEDTETDTESESETTTETEIPSGEQPPEDFFALGAPLANVTLNTDSAFDYDKKETVKVVTTTADGGVGNRKALGVFGTSRFVGKLFKVTAYVMPTEEKAAFRMSVSAEGSDAIAEASYHFDLRANEWNAITLLYRFTQEDIDMDMTSVKIDQLVSGAENASESALCGTFYVSNVSASLQKEATMTMSSIFSNGMVLQRNKPVPVWGWNGTPGETVTATIDNYTASGVVDSNGDFFLELPAMPAGTGKTLTVKSGNATSVFTDVNIGEIWFCSGQSNMQLVIDRTHNTEEIRAKADALKIRSFKVTLSAKYELQRDVSGSWSTITSKTIGTHSAIGYVTAAMLQEELDVPVAIIECYSGGSSAQAWLSYDSVFAEDREAIYNDPSIIPSTRNSRGLEGRTMWQDYDYYWSVGKIYSTTKKEGTLIKGTQGSIGDRFAPAGLYNGMQGPLANFAIAGVMWYQGESDLNSCIAQQYNYILQDLVDQWRQDFRDEKLPVMIVQLAPYDAGSRNFFEVRQVQLDTAKRIEGVEAITTAYEGALRDAYGKSLDLDITTNGNANTIHPGTKIPVAERMFNTIMNTVYGADYEYCGPEYEYLEVEGDKIILHFSHIAGGLRIGRGETKLTGFKISADGVTFVDANAVIQGNTVVVSASSVKSPVAVRYAYVNNVQQRSGNDYLGGNLENSVGQPAFPFVASLSDVSIHKVGADKGELTVELRELGHTTSSYKLVVEFLKGSATTASKTYEADFATAGNYVVTEALPIGTTEVKVTLYDGSTTLDTQKISVNS